MPTWLGTMPTPRRSWRSSNRSGPASTSPVRRCRARRRAGHVQGRAAQHDVRRDRRRARIGGRVRGCRRGGPRSWPVDQHVAMLARRAVHRRHGCRRPGAERRTRTRRGPLLPDCERGTRRRDRRLPGVVEWGLPLRPCHGRPGGRALGRDAVPGFGRSRVHQGDGMDRRNQGVVAKPRWSDARRNTVATRRRDIG